MKKLITVILLIATILNCMMPALEVLAASSNEMAISVDAVEIMEGETTASPTVYLSNNGGVAYVKLAIVAKSSELVRNTEKDPESGLFDIASFSSIRASQLAGYVPAGENTQQYKGFFLSLENDNFNNVYADGALVDIPLSLVSPVAGASYTYYVTVVEALDENEEEVFINGELLEGTVTYVKDENLGKYDDFTMFFAPESVEVKAGEDVRLDLRLDQNPGLWSIRCMIVYPEELSVYADDNGSAIVENGNIFESNALNCGIANLPLTDDRLLIKYREYFEDNGIPTEGYNSTVLYFEPYEYDAFITGNGVLASFTFDTDNCVAGESYDIKVYYADGDIFRAEGNQVFVDLFPATFGATVTTSDCEHPSTAQSRKEPTCGEDGYVKELCTVCGKTVGNTTVLPATGAHSPKNEATCVEDQICGVCGCVIVKALGHKSSTPVTEPATCTEDGSKTVKCSVCGYVISSEVIKAPGHNYLQPGSTVIVPPTCTEGGYTRKTCQVCGDVAIMDETEPDGHTEGSAVIITMPTCTSNGVATVSCDECNELLRTEYIDMIPHSYEKGICTVCGARDEGYSILSAESAEKENNNGIPTSLELRINDNPGLTYIKLVVYYKADELKLSRSTKAFDNSIFSAADSSISIERAGTNSNIVSYLPEGADPSLYRGFVVELCSACDENGVYELIRENGLLAELSLIFANEPAIGDVYTYGVVVAEAYDSDWNEVDIIGTGAEGTVSFVGSPFEGTYSDHTVFIDIRGDEVDMDACSFEADLRVENNPGVWATRAFIVYPDTLKIKGIRNGEVYDEGCLAYGILDLPVSHASQLPQFKELIEEYNIPTEGYNALTVYFEPEDANSRISYDGILATVEFSFAETICEGDLVSIDVYCAEGDIFSSETDENGKVVFVDHDPATCGDQARVISSVCRHTDTNKEIKEPTCTEKGYEKVTCNKCLEVITYIVLNANGHTESTVRVESTCNVKGSETVSCSACGIQLDFRELELKPHTPGNSVEKEATCQREGSVSVYCSECATLISTQKTEDKKDHNYVNGKCTMCKSVVRNENIKLSLVNGGADVEGNINVDVTLKGNPGIWSLRYFVIYPEALVLEGAENGVVFDDKHFVCGVKNLPLGDSAQVGAFKKYLQANNIETQGKCSTLIYYEPDVVSYEALADGILARLSFDFSDVAVSGEEYTVEILCLDGDMFSAGTDQSGMPVFIDYYPVFEDIQIPYGGSGCSHQWKELRTEPTCQNKGVVTVFCSICGTVSEQYELDMIEHDYVRNVCTVCGEKQRNDIFVSLTTKLTDYVHWENITLDVNLKGNPGISNMGYYIVYPDEFYVTGCENGNIFADNAYSNGELNVSLSDASLLPEFKEFLNENNISVAGKLCTYVCFDSGSAIDTVTADGILSSLYFKLAGDIVEGKMYNVDIYCLDGDMFSGAFEDGSGDVIITEYYPTLIGIDVVVFDTDCQHPNTHAEHVENTCFEDGYKGIVCDSCGAFLEKEIIPKEHTPGNPATCTTPQICLVCSSVIKRALGHKTDKDLPCDVDKYCLVCEELIVPAKDHKIDTSLGCTDAKYCTVCGYLVEEGKDHEIDTTLGCSDNKYCLVCKKLVEPAKDHKPDGTDCTVDKYCLVCKQLVEPAKDHTVDKKLGCTDTKYCTVCGAFVEGAKDHEIDTTLGCDVDKYCLVCKKLVEPATEHEIDEDLVCTDDKYCLVCEQLVEPAKDHTVDKKLGCNDTKYCTVCGYLVEEAKAHEIDTTLGCDEDKYCLVCEKLVEPAKEHEIDEDLVCTDDKYCLVCNQLVEPATEHEIDEDLICTEDKYCTVCGTLVEAAKDHTPAAKATVLQKATCCVEGIEVIKCTECGTILSSTIIPKIAHNYVNNRCTMCGLIRVDESIKLRFENEAVKAQPGELLDAPIKLSGNPGIWSIRLFVVYPEELMLESVDNGSIFKDSYLTVGYKDLPLDDARQIAKFKKFIESIGLTKEGYASSVLYYEPDTTSERFSADGILATLSFLLPENAVTGDTYRITLYTLEGDMFDAYLDGSGNIVFEDYYPDTGEMTVTVTDCEHPVTRTETKDHTCYENGYIKVICNECGFVIKETVIKARHIPGSEATCESSQICTVCYAELAPALGHDFTRISDSKNATCTEDGYKQYGCTRCSENGHREIISALGHDFTRISDSKNATCTEDGYKQYGCTRCSENGHREIISALGHSCTSKRTIAATCTEKGEVRLYCTRCTYYIVESIIPELGHEYTFVLESENATCTEDGYKKYGCKRCKEFGYEETILALGHDCTVAVTVDPTCTTTGENRLRCTRCDYYVVDSIIPALGHDFSKVSFTVSASCTGEGYKQYGCTRCSENGHREIIPALGHSCTSKRTIPATCTEKGEVRLYCTRCTYYIVESIIPELGHEYTYVLESENATCTEDGYKKYGCKRCKEFGYEETILALGHDCTVAVTVDPTCTTKGENRLRCTRCDYYVVDSIIPALGHDFSKVRFTVSASCTGEGYKQYGCTRCSENGSMEIIPALGHDCTQRMTIPATCTTEGRELLCCTRCDHNIVEKIIPALGHGDFIVESQQATETTDGFVKSVCGRCKMQISYTIIPATGTGTVDKPLIPDPSLGDEFDISLGSNRNLAMNILGGGRKAIITVLGGDYYILGPDGKEIFRPDANGVTEITFLGYEYAAPIMITICRTSVGEEIIASVKLVNIDSEPDPDPDPDPDVPAGMIGDIDGDGSINGKDMNMLAKVLGGALVLNPEMTAYADINSDGAINGKDTNILAKYLAGAIGSL